MLRRLRIQLTLIYMLAGVFLEVIMGAGLYWRLSSYFQTTTDLALKFQLAQELRQLKAPITPALEEAEQEWKNSLDSGIINRNQLPSTATSSGTFAIQPSQVPTLFETESDGENSEGGGGEHILQPGVDSPIAFSSPPQGRIVYVVRQQIISTPTPISLVVGESNPLLEGELASIFIIPIDSQGAVQSITTGQPSPISPSKEALQSAATNGQDLRTIHSLSGVPIRLLTYRLPDGYQVRYLQLGRPIDDQIRLLNQYLMGLTGISLIILLFVGLLSWWMAGRSLGPAQRSLEEQQAFIANASHELRAPLTLIRAGTELASRSIPEGEPKRLLSDVMRDVDYMNRMVEDLLLLSRLDNKRLTIDRKPVSVNTLLNDIQNQSQMIAGGQIVHTNQLPQDRMVLADPDRLRQVLLILLDNAIQHTPEPGSIQVGAEILRKQIAIQISDSGTGIPAESIPHIFKRFYKVPSHTATQNRGAGLGLSLAKSLVELQHGHIHVESQPGVGTRFTIVLDQSL
jgi:signal transduction histidine kinase